MSRRFYVALAVAVSLLGFGVVGASAETISAHQSTLDEQQDCGSGSITSWHFIINQINSEANAPATITVEWSNGDTEDVPLEKFTGKVGHYTVAGTSEHTLVTSATADIYDGFRGRFNLSSIECGPPADACTPFDDRIIVTFDTRLGDPNVADLVDESSVAVDIAAGTYNVTLQSFDEHSVHGDMGQFMEQWFVRFTTGGSTVESGPIGDLPADQDVLNQSVGTITLASAASQATAVHLLAGGTFSTPESIEPVCVALDPVR